eukprot:1079350-Rhodomonas_salina.4
MGARKKRNAKSGRKATISRRSTKQPERQLEPQGSCNRVISCKLSRSGLLLGEKVGAKRNENVSGSSVMIMRV